MNHIFFHNDCDGIVSTAIYCAASTALDTNDYVLHPVASVMRGQKFERMLNGFDNIHIFDYQYDSRARLWIDHHQTDSIGTEPIMNSVIAYDHTSKSAAALAADYCKRFFTYETNPEIVSAINMIDCAGYPSIEFAFTDTSPMMILRAFLEMAAYPSEMMYCRIVEVLAKTNMDIDRAMQILNIDKGYVKKLRNKAIGVRNHIEVYGDVSVVRQRHPLQNPRFSEALAVATKYNIRITDESATEKRIQMSYNKWHKEPNMINIGKYLKTTAGCSNGGGHFNVGGCVIAAEKVESFLDNFSLAIGEK